MNDGVFIHRRQHKPVMKLKSRRYSVEAAVCPHLFDLLAQRAQTFRIDEQ
ncbi:MAG: hypothetical protein IKH84_00245 [Ottowia sp.]|nr:hypothetical protein [Ottowia sp.]